MPFFLRKGFRVIAHERRGHGRSTQTADGHDRHHHVDEPGGPDAAFEPQGRGAVYLVRTAYDGIRIVG
jgi:pimeloyl-ACP methyl ester carboxylesterase